MGEKREGFGGQKPAGESAPPKVVFETPNYEVIICQLSAGPAEQAKELRIRYVVASKRHPVIAAHSGLEGEAIALALSAEMLLTQAREEAEAAEARGYAPPATPRREEKPGPFGGLSL